MFEHLMNEVECLCSAWGYNILEAIQYIDDHREEYEGTQCLRELQEFMRQGARMFAPAE